MPVTAQWENDSRTLIRVSFSKDWTMSAFFTACEEDVRPMLDGIDHTAHIMVEFASMHVPNGVLTSFHQIADIPQLTHPNSGILVVWGGPRLIDVFGTMFIRVFGKHQKMIMVRNEEEAIATIAKYQA